MTTTRRWITRTSLAIAVALTVGALTEGEACFRGTPPRVTVDATTLRGRVIDASKSPVTNAVVSVSRIEYRRRLLKYESGAKGSYPIAEFLLVRRTVTDAEGSFAFGALNPGFYVIGVSAGSDSEGFELVVKKPKKPVERSVRIVMNAYSCSSMIADVSSSQEGLRF